MSNPATALHLGVPLSAAKVVCVLLHGRGQSPEMMDDHVVRRVTSGDVAYVLPRAPGGSWYQARAIDALTAQTRTELAAALDQIHLLAEEAGTRVPVIIAGFSQGACVAIEYALHNKRCHGVVAFTGCRVGVPTDQRTQAVLDGLPVYLSCSESDPWIPLASWMQAIETFGISRARVRTDLFPGRGHEVSEVEIGVLSRMLTGLGNGAGVGW